MLFRLIVLCASVFLSTSATAADPAKPPGAIVLPAGYAHVPKQGIDSIVGEISKKEGLTIVYEIGRVAKPGAPRLGGDFTDYALAVPEKDRQWLKKQTINGQTVNIAYGKDNLVRISFPDTGANFHATAKNSEELAEVLLIVLTYPTPKK
jgi:hypothetical protein